MLYPNELVIVLVTVIILFPSNIPPVILGLPFLLFFPGYTLVAAPSTTGKGRGWDKALSIILVIVILGALGILGYVIARPKIGERGEGKVVVGIVNREQETATYRVEVAIDGVKNNELGPMTLDHDGKWEEIVSFPPVWAGDNQKVEFLLYQQGQKEVYQRLHLWVNVR